MTHPTREDWMSYLYDELPAERRSTLRMHLDSCTDCRAQMQAWERAAHSLNDFALPPRRKGARGSTIARWAIAAALVAFAAIGAMRVAALNREVKQLRADMQGSFKLDVESPVRVQLAGKMQRDFDAALNQLTDQMSKGANTEAQSLMANWARRFEAQRLADQQTTLTALQKLSTRHTEDYATLRKELETVALFTEASLQRAQNQIATLAYSPVTETNNK